jgi:hypothetical protein
MSSDQIGDLTMMQVRRYRYGALCLGEPWAILYVHWSEIASQLHQPNPLLHISSNLLLSIVSCNITTTVLPWKMLCCLSNISEIMLGEMTRNSHLVIFNAQCTVYMLSYRGAVAIIIFIIIIIIIILASVHR